ncbi:MAG: phenylalanine--tRNA ligase subunit alpha [Elusimicrobia bacterium RIFCSPLOWO2_12_FULL_59_9]|nr:MAG: phenylalanine--tRNA ligase subunit alpha [Elusimicrobia bacterium RIFCSPLOWO2_12_FULL_59_9]
MPGDTKVWEEKWNALQESCLPAVEAAADLDSLENLRIKFLGRKGGLTELLAALKDLPVADRRRLGPLGNDLRSRLEALLESRKRALFKAAVDRDLAGVKVDMSLPATPHGTGTLHPLTQTMEELVAVLNRLGFQTEEGPLVETDYYNFEALNIPPEHPARDMHDTFYVGADGLLLRTHTSPVQIRKMLNSAPPVRIVVPGRVFRHEAVDASHSAVFHQVEGLYVDRDVTMVDLKGTLLNFARAMFGARTQVRFKPSYFPFTEPSVEVDVQCLLCGGGGCAVCKQSGWLEMLGAGMVHPNVFRAVGYDPSAWKGFAFGIGVDRVAMLRYEISDIRLLYQNDLRFLTQF